MNIRYIIISITKFIVCIFYKYAFKGYRLTNCFCNRKYINDFNAYSNKIIYA